MLPIVHLTPRPACDPHLVPESDGREGSGRTGVFSIFSPSFPYTAQGAGPTPASPTLQRQQPPQKSPVTPRKESLGSSASGEMDLLSPLPTPGTGASSSSSSRRDSKKLVLRRMSSLTAPDMHEKALKEAARARKKQIRWLSRPDLVIYHFFGELAAFLKWLRCVCMGVAAGRASCGRPSLVFPSGHLGGRMFSSLLCCCVECRPIARWAFLPINSAHSPLRFSYARGHAAIEEKQVFLGGKPPTAKLLRGYSSMQTCARTPTHTYDPPSPPPPPPPDTHTLSFAVATSPVTLFLVIPLTGLWYILEQVEGPHEAVMDELRVTAKFVVWWFGLGVLSSVGLGTGRSLQSNFPLV